MQWCAVKPPGSPRSGSSWRSKKSFQLWWEGPWQEDPAIACLESGPVLEMTKHRGGDEEGRHQGCPHDPTSDNWGHCRRLTIGIRLEAGITWRQVQETRGSIYLLRTTSPEATFIWKLPRTEWSIAAGVIIVWSHFVLNSGYSLSRTYVPSEKLVFKYVVGVDPHHCWTVGAQCPAHLYLYLYLYLYFVFVCIFHSGCEARADGRVSKNKG